MAVSFKAFLYRIVNTNYCGEDERCRVLLNKLTALSHETRSHLPFHIRIRAAGWLLEKYGLTYARQPSIDYHHDSSPVNNNAPPFNNNEWTGSHRFNAGR